MKSIRLTITTTALLLLGAWSTVLMPACGPQSTVHDTGDSRLLSFGIGGTRFVGRDAGTS